MAPFEALYGKKCRSPVHWDEVGERTLLGPELVQQTTKAIKIIRERMRTAQSRQKSYADNRRKELEFKVGDHVFLKVAPMKGIMCFGPFEILERVGHYHQPFLPYTMSFIYLCFENTCSTHDK